MREILFRGKRTDNGEWVYGAYYKQTEFYGEPAEEHFIITTNESLDYDQALVFYGVDPATVGQYTGLKDKNGKRIFEGDEVRYPDNIGYVEYDEDWNEGVVDWDDEEMLFYFTNRWSVAMGDFDIVDGKMIDVEVIGNIHDNLELAGGVET